VTGDEGIGNATMLDYRLGRTVAMFEEDRWSPAGRA
jgi:hypothetical protein